MKTRGWIVMVLAMTAGGARTSAGQAPPPAVPGAIVASGDALAVRVYPTVIGREEDAWVTLRLEPDARSVSVQLSWWSDEGGAGSHLFTLDGARAAVRHQYQLRRLDPGEYAITAVLTRNDGTTVGRTARLLVAGGR